MKYLPDTNACITLLRNRDPRPISRWQSTKASDLVLCSIVVYELRHRAARSSNSIREQARLDLFPAPFTSLPFDDQCAGTCAEISTSLEQSGHVIGPHDLMIASIAKENDLILVTHNTKEFSRIAGLKLEDWEA